MDGCCEECGTLLLSRTTEAGQDVPEHCQWPELWRETGHCEECEDCDRVCPNCG